MLTEYYHRILRRRSLRPKPRGYASETCLRSQRMLLISAPTLLSPDSLQFDDIKWLPPAPKTIGCWFPLASDPNLMSHSCRNQYESLCWNMFGSNHIFLKKRDALWFHSELLWKTLSGKPRTILWKQHSGFVCVDLNSALRWFNLCIVFHTRSHKSLGVYNSHYCASKGPNPVCVVFLDPLPAIPSHLWLS